MKKCVLYKNIGNSRLPVKWQERMWTMSPEEMVHILTPTIVMYKFTVQIWTNSYMIMVFLGPFRPIQDSTWISSWLLPSRSFQCFIHIPPQQTSCKREVCLCLNSCNNSNTVIQINHRRYCKVPVTANVKHRHRNR